MKKWLALISLSVDQLKAKAHGYPHCNANRQVIHGNTDTGTNGNACSNSRTSWSSGSFIIVFLTHDY